MVSVLPADRSGQVHNINIHSDLIMDSNDSDAAAICDGDLVVASGWLVRNDQDCSLCPPQPEDRARVGSTRRAVGEDAIRLLHEEAAHGSAIAPEWVRITGVWVERQITVRKIEREPMDLSLIDPPEPPSKNAPVFGADLARRVGRVFADRYRRWDLIALGRGSGDRPGPVAYVAATRPLLEVNEYLASLPVGAVDFRSWLKPA